MFLFDTMSKKMSATDKNTEAKDPHGEDSVELHLNYSKVAKTRELQIREVEEKLRKQYNIKKDKSGDLI